MLCLIKYTKVRYENNIIKIHAIIIYYNSIYYNLYYHFNFNYNTCKFR